MAIPSAVFRGVLTGLLWLVTTLGLAGVNLLPGQSVPRLGTDSGAFRLNVEYHSTDSIADFQQSEYGRVQVDLRIHIWRVAGDTLRFTAVVDSVTIYVDSVPIGPSSSVTPFRPLDFGKGDSLILLLSPSAKLLRRVSGAQDLLRALSLFVDMPAVPESGSQWRGPPILLEAKPLIWDSALLPVVTENPRMLRDSTSMSFVGQRGDVGQSLWSFTSTTRLTNVRNVVDFFGTFGINQLSSYGSMSLGTDGRIIDAKSTTSLESYLVQSNTRWSSKSTTTAVFWRIR